MRILGFRIARERQSCGCWPIARAPQEVLLLQIVYHMFVDAFLGSRSAWQQRGSGLC